MDYDIIIIGAGPGGIYSAYELTKEPTDLKIAVFEAPELSLTANTILPIISAAPFMSMQEGRLLLI